MNALGSIKSLALTKHTGLSIVLGCLFVLSPLYADFGGSALATITAIVLGVLAMAVAAAEAAGSPRFRNHGWPLAAIAAVILVAPWIMALTGVGQVLGTFSLMAIALVAAATWRIVSASENKPFVAKEAESMAESATRTSTIAEGDQAGEDTTVVSSHEQDAPAVAANAQDGNEPSSTEQVHAQPSKASDEKRPRSAKVHGIAKNRDEVQHANGSR